MGLLNIIGGLTNKITKPVEINRATSLLASFCKGQSVYKYRGYSHAGLSPKVWSCANMRLERTMKMSCADKSTRKRDRFDT